MLWTQPPSWATLNETTSIYRQEDRVRSLSLSVAMYPATLKIMETLMRQTDILVDSAYRRDASKPVVPNDWIAWLPEHAVITDLSVDPYTLDIDPPVVRGVEGIPQGNLNQYIFYPDDPNWENTIPSSIPTTHRRTTVTCYSWPGIHPEASMLHYATQLEPLMHTLLQTGYNNLKADGEYFERALYRASLELAW